MSERTIDELAVQAKQGQQEALTELLVHKEFRAVVFKIANEHTGSTEAEDIYQDVCEAVCKKIHTWQERAAITTWIGKVTYHICLDFLRRTPQKMTVVTDSVPDEVVEAEQINAVSQKIVTDIAHKTLETLAEECRRFMTLHLIKGLESNDVIKMCSYARTTFYRKWNNCYNGFVKEIQKKLQKQWE